MNTPSQTHFILMEKFVNKILIYMASLDVDPLLTNIPLDETIDICIDGLYKDDENTLRSLKMFFVIYLMWPPRNCFFNV